MVNEWLLHRCGQSTRLFARLSDVNFPIARPQQLTPQGLARKSYNRMLSGQQITACMIGAALGDQWVLWAPHMPDSGASLAQGYRTFTAQAPRARLQQFKLHMLIPFGPVVGVTEAPLLLGIWWHPLLKPKCKEVATQITATSPTGPTNYDVEVYCHRHLGGG